MEVGMILVGIGILFLGVLAGVAVSCFCIVARNGDDYEARRDYYDKGYDDGYRAGRGECDECKKVLKAIAETGFDDLK